MKLIFSTCIFATIFFNGLNALARRIELPSPAPYSFDESTVKRLKVRGEYGRYITFIGKSVNEYHGTSSSYDPGSPGSLRCTTYGTLTTCDRAGYRPPRYTPGSPGGFENRYFVYSLDCVDRTFDRKGDSLQGIFNKGWMNVLADPVAEVVADKYCPIIDSLPIHNLNLSKANEYYSLGNIKFRKRDFSGAVDYYGKSIDIAPASDTYFNRANAKDELGDYQGALSDYQKAIELNPTGSDAYYNRAILKEAIGDMVGACNDFKMSFSMGDIDAGNLAKQACD